MGDYKELRCNACGKMLMDLNWFCDKNTDNQPTCTECYVNGAPTQ